MFAKLEVDEFFLRLMKHDEFRDGPAQKSNSHIHGYRTLHYHKDASYPFKKLVDDVMNILWSSCRKRIMHYVEVHIKKKIFDPGLHKATEQSELSYDLRCPSRIWAGQSRRKGKNEEIEQIYSQLIKRKIKLLGGEKEEKFKAAIDWSFRKYITTLTIA